MKNFEKCLDEYFLFGATMYIVIEKLENRDKFAHFLLGGGKVYQEYAPMDHFHLTAEFRYRRYSVFYSNIMRQRR